MNLIEEGERTSVYEIVRSESETVSVRALKVISLELTDHPPDAAVLNGLVERINREIKVITGLNGHPHIAGIEEYAILKGGSSILVMFRMEKMLSLTDYIRAGGLKTRDEIIRLGTEICDALDFCDRQSVIHRNIKISNLFFTEQTGFKLSDFDIPCTADPAFKTPSGKESRDTPFSAPEVFRSGHCDRTADIYSLGIVLYTLLNDSRPPFTGGDQQQAQAEQPLQANGRHLNGGSFPPPKNADETLAHTVLKACSCQPSDRYRTAAEFKAALTECLEKKVSPEEEEITSVIFDPAPAQKPSSAEPVIPPASYPSNDRGSSSRHDSKERNLIPLAAAAAIAALLAVGIFFITASFWLRTPSVKYRITYVDENGTLLEETIYKGHVGDEIIHKAPDKKGYILNDRKQSLVLEKDEDQNYLIFHYEHDSGGNETVQTPSMIVSETDPTTTEAPATTTTRTITTQAPTTAATRTTTAQTPTTTTTRAPEVVIWDDPDFEKAAREYLNFQGDLTAASAANVRKLELKGANIHSIKAIRYFTGLEELYLSDNEIEDVSPLAELDNVYKVHLENNKVHDLSPLKNKTNITRLDLCDNQVSDLSPLQTLTRMVMLDVRRNQVKDISALKEMVNMDQLYLSENQIRDISAVAGMKDLTYLAIGYNEIEDISCLKSMSRLAVLTMKNNKVRDISVLRNCPLIYHLKILNNPIQDYSPLKMYEDSVYIDYYDG